MTSYDIEENPKILAQLERAKARAAARTPAEAAQAAERADARHAAMQAEIDAEADYKSAQIAAFENTYYRGEPMKKPEPPDSNIIPFSWAQKPKTEPKPQQQKPLHQKLFDLLMIDESRELERISRQPMLIDGVLPAQSFGVIYGESGCGKSFIALDMVMSVATGQPWCGYDTEQGQVVYISAEGGSGMRIRKRAWEQCRDLRAPLMRVLPQAITLNSDHELNALRSALDGLIKHTGSPIKLVIIDTLARSMTGDENLASDMSAFVNSCDELKVEFGCTVVVIHHSGKDTERGARGSSALRAACDFEILVSGSTKSQVSMTSKKAKDCPEFSTMVFTFDSVELEELTDYKGRPYTSLVPKSAGFGETLLQAARPNERELLILNIVTKCGGRAHVDAVRELFYESPEISDLKPNSRRTVFQRSVAGLANKFLISHEDNGYVVSSLEVIKSL